MNIPEGSEPISDDELLYRRIPESQGWFTPQAAKPVSPEAFRPTQSDTTGLSLWRAEFKSIEEAAQGRQGKQYITWRYFAQEIYVPGELRSLPTRQFQDTHRFLA